MATASFSNTAYTKTLPNLLHSLRCAEQTNMFTFFVFTLVSIICKTVVVRYIRTKPLTNAIFEKLLYVPWQYQFSKPLHVSRQAYILLVQPVANRRIYPYFHSQCLNKLWSNEDPTYVQCSVDINNILAYFFDTEPTHPFLFAKYRVYQEALEM